MQVPTKSTTGKRVSYEFRYYKKAELLLVRWNDSKVASVMSKYDSLEPMGKVMCCDSNKNKWLEVSQPNLIRCYNSGLGNVTRHDWILGFSDVTIRGKKWYWCFVT